MNDETIDLNISYYLVCNHRTYDRTCKLLWTCVDAGSIGLQKIVYCRRLGQSQVVFIHFLALKSAVHATHIVTEAKHLRQSSDA